ncbi:DNA gyrase subunit B [Brevibacillus sp. SYP-B805]|uniref:DNA gyrase/topoisomerase IV subunit B n=1 Tax=Brevibacillus sp. SYP-B805 TaxID=1578199 RepID=UPI0013ED32E3|nr:DNA gyrase subunit B [Brevibacillus sp. SYP-B805]NGQ96309.1 DNA gyrase subunit B [Brevibacillus sp. SYP-B805]
MKEHETLTYTEEDIQVLEGLIAVRKRPGMYIGSTGSRGLHHLLWEIVDNAKDETLAGFNDTIIVTLEKDGSVSVEDHGRGIPTGMHKSGRPVPEVIFTTLHAGGKFGGGGYKKSGGLHGVGSSVVVALSKWLEVEIHLHGKIHKQRFAYVVDENGVEHVGKPVTGLEVVGTTNRTGTTVTFLPDDAIFSTTRFDYELIRDRLRETAFLLKKLRLVLIDKRGPEVKREEFYYEDGLKSYVAYLNEGKQPLHPVVYFDGEKDDVYVELAFQYNDGYTETLVSYVNSIPTTDGGTHVTGFRNATTRVFNEFARRKGYLKEKDANLTGNDLREGFLGVLSLQMADVQFESQTKDKLGNEEARTIVEQVVAEKLGYFLEENPEIAKLLIEKAIRSAEIREELRKQREALRGDKKGKGTKKRKSISDKFAPPQHKDPKRNELFLVEGDSAGGSAKQARNSEFQAIFGLKGKPLNTEKAKLSEVLSNEEFRTILEVLETDIGEDFSIENCAFDKIIIMSDADVDGSHIQTLLLTFFFRYMQPLIAAGKLYIAQPPLYQVRKETKGKEAQVIYCWNDAELEQALKKLGRGAEVQRYKGLGEMNADQLWETTMNPETRKLIKVSLEDLAHCEKLVTVLMGDKVPPRREWIESHVTFEVGEDE